MAYNPVTNLYTPTAMSYGSRPLTTNQPSNPNDFLQKLGFGDLITSGQNDVRNLLDGNVSADAVRTANAYFGANSGMPNSDYVKYRGADLYGQQAQQNKLLGLDNLTKLISGVSAPTLQNQGQQFQNQQFGADLNQRGNQFDQNLQLQQFLAQLQAIGLGNSIVNSGKNQIPNFNF